MPRRPVALPLNASPSGIGTRFPHRRGVPSAGGPDGAYLVALSHLRVRHVAMTPGVPTPSTAPCDRFTDLHLVLPFPRGGGFEQTLEFAG